jgi:hypothetical protein
MSVHKRVGTWTLLFSTRTVIKASRDGSVESPVTTAAPPWVGGPPVGKAPFVGVAGGVGRGAAGGGPHWMTEQAFAERYAAM